MDRLQRLVRTRSGWIAVSFALLTLLAAAAATRITIDGSVEQLLMSDDPARALDARAKEEFGNDEVLMVAFDLGAPYGEADLRRLARISEAMAALPGVSRVVDLSSTEDIRGDGDTLDASALVDLDTLSEDLAAIRERTRDHRLYGGLLVSEAQDVFGMLIYAEETEGNSEAMNDLAEAVIAVAESEAPPWEAHFAGYPITAFEVNRIVKRDLGVLTPACLAVISAILVAFTRRLFPVALLLALVAWVEAVALAWLALTGTPLNVVVSALPTILLATSGTYVIYTLGLLGRVSGAPDPGAALLRLLVRPVLLSGLSTGIGFVSLGVMRVQAIGDLGPALAVGIFAATAGSLLLVPALIERFGLRLDPRPARELERLSLVGVRLARRPVAVLVASLGLVAVALPGLSRLAIHTDTLDYFEPGNRIREGARFFQDHLSSGFLVSFVLRGEGENRALDPEVLAFAERAVEHAEAFPGVDRTISMLDYFFLMDAALRPGAEPRANPGSRQAAAQYLLLYESSGDPEDYDRYLSFDRSALRLLVSVRGGSSVYLALADALEALAPALPPGVTLDALGSTYLYSRAMDTLTRGMLTGLAVAAALIGVVMVVGLRSLRLAAVAVFPNLAPLLLCGGLLGWLDVPLSMGTSLVGCLALGLAVDDTAHVLGHADRRHSLEAIYRLVGPPVILTTVALGLGFCALTLSEFQSVEALGLATAATLVVALLCDLLLLPSLLRLLGYRLWSEHPSASLADGLAREPARS